LSPNLDMKAIHVAGQSRTAQRLLSAAVGLALAVSLTACGDKKKEPGQSVASVNGEEITVLQLNDELARANVPAAQQQAASKQLLESLIDRQLLVNAALKDKLDRDPKVVQAMERAKALILAQSYLQKRVGAQTPPTKAEIEDYYAKHPELFSQRKVFDLRQLVLASKDLGADVNKAMDSAKSLEEVAAWLDAHQIKYARAQASRSSTDLPPELSKKLQEMNKGQLFIVREGERALLISLAEVKEAPMTLDVAGQQIGQFLMNKKNKDGADAEMARLRAAAKIEYLNKQDAPAAPAASAPAAAPAAPAAAAAESSAADANARGVAGLK